VPDMLGPSRCQNWS